MTFHEFTRLPGKSNAIARPTYSAVHAMLYLCGHTVEAQLTLILSGRFIGYLPEHYARSGELQGTLRRLLPRHFHFRAPFSFAFRRGRARETLIRAMREILNPARKNSSES